MQRSNDRQSRLQKLESDPRDKLADLAWRIRRLGPDHRNPHRFHEEKSEIAHELLRMARRQ